MGISSIELDQTAVLRRLQKWKNGNSSQFTVSPAHSSFPLPHVQSNHNVTDELEHGRAKNALAEIEKYQKRYSKQANSPIIGALKCVALQRQRKDDEAYQSFLAMVRSNSKGSKAQSAGNADEEIPDDVVIDESTLHTLGYALRPMRKSECTAEIWSLNPDPSQFRSS